MRHRQVATPSAGRLDSRAALKGPVRSGSRRNRPARFEEMWPVFGKTVLSSILGLGYRYQGGGGVCARVAGSLPCLKCIHLRSRHPTDRTGVG